METYAVLPRGYCYGVVNAIKVAKQARIDHPGSNIYILGMIVHNKYIMKALDLLNIITLDDTIKTREQLIDEINDGIVILSAHGSAPIVKEKALAKGLIVYDATCKDVIKTHDLIIEYLFKGYDILYYGKKNHPEANAALALDEKKVHLVCNLDDLDNLKLVNNNVFITNQTTLSILDAQAMFDKAAKLFPNIIVAEEICNATRIRQEAVLKIPSDIELVYVVGDIKSNNSNKLATLASNENVKLIESIEDIDIADLKGINKVAITSGASTPTYLTNMVISYLKQFDYNNKDTYLKPKIDLHKILD